MPKKNKKAKASTTARTNDENEKSKSCNVDQDSSQNDLNPSAEADTAKSEKNSFCLPLDKKLKIQIKRQKKKEKKKAFDALNLKPTVNEESTNEELDGTQSCGKEEPPENTENKEGEVVDDKSCDVECEKDNVSDYKSPELKEKDVKCHSEVSKPEAVEEDVNGTEFKEEVNETVNPSTANYNTEIIHEDSFVEFVESEGVKVRETIKARHSPLPSPNSRRKNSEREALMCVTSCPPPKVLYNYQGASYVDTNVGGHIVEDVAPQDYSGEQDTPHNRKLDIIQEESSDFSDASGRSDQNEKSKIRAVLMRNRLNPVDGDVHSEIRDTPRLYTLHEEIKEDIGGNCAIIDDSHAIHTGTGQMVNDSSDSKTESGEKESLIEYDQTETSYTSIEGTRLGLEQDNENVKSDEEKNPAKEGTDYSEKSSWSIKSISTNSIKPFEEESESWRSSIEPETYGESEADAESELESQRFYIFDNYSDLLGFQMLDVLPENDDDGIQLFVTDYKYENGLTGLNKTKGAFTSDYYLKHSPKHNKSPADHREDRTGPPSPQVLSSSPGKTNQSNKEVVAHLSSDGYSTTFKANGDVSGNVIDFRRTKNSPLNVCLNSKPDAAMSDDTEKLLISKIKVMKSFEDSTFSEESCCDSLAGGARVNPRKNYGDSSWVRRYMSNSSSYENVSRSEKLSPAAEVKVGALKAPKNPDALSNLAEKKILTLPYGKLVLKKIGLGKCCYKDSESGKDVEEEIYMKSGARENELSFGMSSELSDASVRSVPLSIWNRIRASGDREFSESRSYIEFDYGDSRIGQTEKWYGTRTVVPAVLLGLSPSQKKAYEEKSNKFMAEETEASNLIDLHRKFLERRCYNETNSNERHRNVVFDSVTLTEIGEPDRISGKLTQSQPENKKSHTLDKVKEMRIAKGNMQSTNKFGITPDRPKTRLVGNVNSKTEVNLSKANRNDESQENEGNYSRFCEKRKFEEHGKMDDEDDNDDDDDVVGKSCLLAVLQNAISDNFVPELNKDSSTKSTSESHEVPSVQNQGTMLNSWHNNPIFGYTGNNREKEMGNDWFGDDRKNNFERIWNKEKNITMGERNRPRTICCGAEFQVFGKEPVIEKKVAPGRNLQAGRRKPDEDEYLVITEKLPAVSAVIKSFEEPKTQTPARNPTPNGNVTKGNEVQIDREKYRISKKGDIAFLQDGERERKRIRKEYRKSMPACLLSEKEIFKQKMYDEYMAKLAERIERRQKKVIRVSQSSEFPEFPDVARYFDIENEFIKKVRERREKLALAGGRRGGDVEKDLDSLEKKCQEFTDYWKGETTNLENGKLVLEEIWKEKNKDGDTDSSNNSKRSSIHLILDTNSDVDSLPKHLKELLEVDKEDFPDFFDGLRYENMSSSVLFSPSFKATAFRPGVWSPNQRASVERNETKEEENQERKKLEDEPIPPVWTPKSAQASPVLEKKEFRPVNFESPVLSRKKYTQEEKRESSVPPPWQQPGGDKLPELAKSPSSPALSLPKAPNPTVTLLQKAREGRLPRGAHYLNSKMNDSQSADESIIEKLELVSSSSATKSSSERPRNCQGTPKKVTGIGPTTKEGIPLVLRSEVNAENKEKWYKRMYDSLHKAGSDDDYVTVKYRTSPNRRGIYGYKYGSTSGYQSEPESLNYDLSSNNYVTLDRRREEEERQTKETVIPVANEPIITKTRVSPPRREYFPGYKNQPGKIEDYEPGRCSISEVEANKWWDEVLEIFDREEEKSRPIRTPQPSRSFTNYASGYISDPQFVYKRSGDDLQSPPSSEEQKEAYKIIQKGGEIPLKGLRKPAPERPKDDVETEIEYFPLSSTLTRIRVHKQNITPLSDYPFYLNPSLIQEATLSFPNLTFGVCSSYSQVEIFPPWSQSEGPISNANLSDTGAGLSSTEKDQKFSVHLQNISEPNEYVPIVPRPRNNHNKSPIYANLPLTGRSCSPELSDIKEEECQRDDGVSEAFSGSSENSSSIRNSRRFATFSDLKRIAPSIVSAKSGKTPLTKVVKKVKESRVEKKSSIPVVSSLNKQKKFNSKLDNKENINKGNHQTLSKTETKTTENHKKKERKEISSKILLSGKQENRIKKATKKSKHPLSESLQRERKPLSKTTAKSEHLKSPTENLSTKRTETKIVRKKGGVDVAENTPEDSAVTSKVVTTDYFSPNSDCYNLQLDASKVKKPRVCFDVGEEEKVTDDDDDEDEMSSYENVEPDSSGSKQKIDVDMTEVYRSRSFSPDAKRKIFKFPDMNKPLPPKKKHSKHSPTLKMWSKMKVTYPSHRSRLDEFGSNIKFLQDKIKRKLKDDAKIEFRDDVETVRTVKKDKNGEMSIKTNRYVRLGGPLSVGAISARATYPDLGRRHLLSESCRTKYGSVDALRVERSGDAATVNRVVTSSDLKRTSSTIVKRSPSSIVKRECDRKKAVEVSLSSSRKTTAVALPPKKSSSSPSPSLCSYRSGISAKSPLSDKGSTSSQERMRSSQTRLISPNSSASRLSVRSGSTSPGSMTANAKTQKASDIRTGSKKANVVRATQKPLSQLAKSTAVKAKASAKTPTASKYSGERLYFSKIVKPNSTKEDLGKTRVSKIVVAECESLKKDKIGKTKVIVVNKSQQNSFDTCEKEKNEIAEGRDLVRTDSFFQNLFLRNAAAERSLSMDADRMSSVLERAQMYQRRINWPETYKSEPSLSLVTYYLNQKRPVSFSKFRRIDRDLSSSRSQSPLGSFHSENFQMKLRRFDSMSQFGDVSHRDFSPEDKERSSSEPPMHRSASNSPDEGKHSRISHSEASSARSSPISSRSPSCRRIMSYRSSSKPLECYRHIRKICSRARSAGAIEDIKSRSLIHGELADSTSSLNLSNMSDRAEYQEHILELMHSTRKCERFRELHKFYSNLERMEKLEKTASTGDLRPRLRNEEIIDFDRWKKVRIKERAEAELKALTENMVKTQKEKDLLFRAANVEAIRWKGDRGLRIKERSVENLKDHFNRYSQEGESAGDYWRKDMQNDNYKSLWKGCSVVGLAGSLSNCSTSHRGRPVAIDDLDKMENARIRSEYGCTLKAWNGLTNEEVKVLKGQLSEIYTQEAHRKRLIDRSDEYLEKYDVIVPDDKDIKSPGENSLHVRCSSAMSKSQTFTPTVKRKEIIRREWEKANSVSALPSLVSDDDQSGTLEFSKLSRSHSETRHLRQEYFPGSSRSKSETSKPLSEDEKKQLSMTLSREVIEKMTKGTGKAPVLPRETMGALAVAGGKLQERSSSPSKPSSDSDFLLIMTSTDTNRDDEFVHEWKTNVEQTIKPAKSNVISEPESGSGSSETSIKTVIRKNSVDVLKKVQYFEDLQQGPEFYTAECKWNDEYSEEAAKEVEYKKVFIAKDKNADRNKKDVSGQIRSETKKEKSKTIVQRSSSLENLNNCFSENKQYGTNKSSEKFISTESSRTLIPLPVRTEDNTFEENKWIPIRYDSTSPVAFKRIPSRSGSNESLFSYRSRSVSPDPTKYYRAYLRMVKCGAVKKLCNKFESSEDLLSLSSDKDFWLPPAPRRFASDPELTRDLLKRFGTDPTKVTIRGQEVGDVRWLRTKFEKDLNPTRGRSRFRRIRSPLLRSPITSSGRFMPRINVISKKAELQMQGLEIKDQGKSSTRSVTSPTRPNELPASPEGYRSLIDYTNDHGGYYFTGEVEKLKRKFEKLQEAERLSILGQMYTSTPDVNELRDIAPYLECAWVAHRYPGGLKSPEPEIKKREIPQKVQTKPRPRSSSPIRTKQPLSILKHSCPPSDEGGIFADQKFDPSIHRPKYRYQPEREVDRKYKRGDPVWWRPWNKPTVTFKEPVDFNFEPDVPDVIRPDSPRKYVESEVTIHYKSPVRSEAKAMLSEDELARRQAESMKRIYKEERRRKYLQELQDMNNRRHTDNFTPSQKSPIPLNRYDDFPFDCNLYYKGKDYAADSVLVARGLYDFVGKRPRELAFRRGDIIFIMRRLDKNWCEGELNGAVGLFPLSYVEVIPYNEINMKFGRARAKYDFIPQTPLELSVRKGDMITLIRKIDENWFEGRMGERTGIIPASYCHIMAMPQASRTALRADKASKPVAAPAAHSLIHDGSGLSSKHYYAPHLSSPNSPGRSTVSSTSAGAYHDGHFTADMLIDEALMQLDEEFDLKRTNSKQTANARVNPRPEPTLYRVLFNHVPNNDDELELVQGETVTVVEKCGDGWYIGSKTSDGNLGIFPGTHVRPIAPEFV